jgi:hypothetical protein
VWGFVRSERSAKQAEFSGCAGIQGEEAKQLVEMGGYFRFVPWMIPIGKKGILEYITCGHYSNSKYCCAVMSGLLRISLQGRGMRKGGGCCITREHGGLLSTVIERCTELTGRVFGCGI